MINISRSFVISHFVQFRENCDLCVLHALPGCKKCTFFVLSLDTYIVLEHVRKVFGSIVPYRLEDSAFMIDHGMWLTPIAGRAVPVVIKGDLFQFSPRNVRNASMRKRTPSMMLMDPLAKPVSRNVELWLNLWKKSMFNAPAAMNKAHPMSEKKRSTRRFTGVPITLPMNKPTKIIRYPPNVPIVIIAV